MPAHRLTSPASSPTESAIWRLLAGDDLQATATAHGLDPAQLAAVASVYRSAGRDALSTPPPDGWQQLYLRFTDWDRAEEIAAAHLLPELVAAQHRGAVSAWWFMRKHPCWRLRLLPTGDNDASAELLSVLNSLASAGHLDGWWLGTYEPETAAFGGPTGIQIAHRLFTADSRSVLELTRSGGTGLGRRELSILLWGTLMHHGAALEWYERGDVWDRVAAERRLPADIPTAKLAAMAENINVLARTDTNPDGPLFAPDGPLAGQKAWAEAFRDAGRDLADAHRAGILSRGLRDVLSYHVIFHWNRLGLPARTQAILAHAARQAILGPPGRSGRTPTNRADIP